MALADEFSYALYIALTLGAICVSVAIVGKWPAQRIPRDCTGRAMIQIRGDTRVRRFTHGLEISNEGNAAAQGEPYVMCNGRQKEVVLCRPHHVREFYTGDARAHWKVPDGNLGYFVHRLLGHCVALQNGQKWRDIRQLFDPLLSHAATMKLLETFRKDVRDWLELLPQEKESENLGEGRFTADVTASCVQLPLKMVARTFYGDMLSEDVFTELTDLAAVRRELGSKAFLRGRAIYRLYSLMPTKLNRLLDDYVQRFRDLNVRVVSHAEKAGIDCPLRRVFHAQRTEGKVSMLECLQTIDEVLFENIDSGASALSFLLTNVATDTQVQAELGREASRLVPDPAPDAVKSYLARSDTFLDLCCQESRRLCPVIFFLLAECAPLEKMIDGFHIPAGTHITIDWQRINIHSPIWSRPIGEAKKEITGYDFYPWRFRHISRSESRYSLVGYGCGTRQCIGLHFSNVFMRLFLYEIVLRYRVTADKGPWDLGFRSDRSIITPKRQDITFEQCGETPLPRGQSAEKLVELCD